MIARFLALLKRKVASMLKSGNAEIAGRALARKRGYSSLSSSNSALRTFCC